MAEWNERVLGKAVAIGNAVLYRQDRLERVRCGELSASNRSVAVAVRGCRGTALASLGRTVIISVHLDAGSEEMRVGQIARSLSCVRHAGARDAVIVGDMNTGCAPGTCIAAFVDGAREPAPEEFARECGKALRVGASSDDCVDDGADDTSVGVGAPTADAPTEAQLREWRALWKKAREAVAQYRVGLARVPTGPTRAAYENGEVSGPCTLDPLDHIFYSSRALTLRAAWAALGPDAEAMPNRTCPSDHIPVAAVFQPLPVPTPSAEEEAVALARFDEMDARHVATVSALEEALKLQEPPPQPEEPARSDGDSTAAQPKKKNKKSQKPPPEVIAYIRESRRQHRELKEQQEAERGELVCGLRDLERDVVEARLCLVTWAKTGARKPPSWD
eukprot:NODE_6958_length_1621_cov_9.708835.p1 GENE.NODE_6958_length_1621_cov_9.708835~~NODE_6958_length_1621_cov_9.708835.p1  ORF type:complete len:411 (-),score=127.91 NODE_6958_length_1621_cov_9.708835:389-1558(-)